ncbi:MAG TPA: BolA/IbaG family iron-sulfur metabolism protein [Steroidobacteraceae bacterium]
MTPADISQQIEMALPGATVRVVSDDNVHFSALVIAPQFVGMRTLQRHQLVYRALGGAMGGEIHALSLETPSPDEWAGRNAG